MRDMVLSCDTNVTVNNMELASEDHVGRVLEFDVYHLKVAPCPSIGLKDAFRVSKMMF